MICAMFARDPFGSCGENGMAESMGVRRLLKV